MLHVIPLLLVPRLVALGPFQAVPAPAIPAAPGLISQAGDAGSPTPLEEVRQEGAELLDALRTFTIERRGELTQLTEKELVQLDGRIEELRRQLARRWSRMGRTAREQATASLQALQERRAELDAWLQRLRGSSGPGWERTKQGLAQAYGGVVEMLRSMAATEPPP